ncbi:unnamed protein product [Paramecium sonneborni]|uniref:Uncharacterized protein n=1 Tax=Paramecium sonneborni TaxID=65129 RepID=A0A8S1RAV9_9CILI|nr:unnamed protein product [Paramecium sonneborni]
MNLKISIPQEKQIYEFAYDENTNPFQISSIICQVVLLPKAIIPTTTKFFDENNQELDLQKTLQDQGISPQKQIYFYYSQSIKIQCLCNNQNFICVVNSLKKIGDYSNTYKQIMAQAYSQYKMVVLYQGKPQNLETYWFETGINDSSLVEFKILLPLQLTYFQDHFQEYIPSTWKVHQIITHIIEKKQIKEIIQITQKNKIIEYDLELSQLYSNLNNWQIEDVKEPSYQIQLKDGTLKIVKIQSKKKVGDLCELIKKEFNILKSVNLELQYGLITLNNQTFIIDQMILNNSVLIVNNQNLVFNDQFQEKINNQINDNNQEKVINQIEPKQKQLDSKQNNEVDIKSDDRLQIILLNKKNKQQILYKFIIQYFQGNNKPINNITFGDLEKDQKNNIKIEFLIQKQKPILKNISSFSQIYEFQFIYNSQLIKEKVDITKTLQKIENQIKQKYNIPELYSLFSEGSFDENQTIIALGLQQLNIIFEFKSRNPDTRTFQTIIYPNKVQLISQISQIQNVFQLRERIKKEYLKENDQAIIQIKFNQQNLHDNQQLSELVKENNTQIFEATILDQFEVKFQGLNQYKLTDQVYEDYLIKESVICLGLQEYDFFNRQNPIKIENSFQFYKINKQNQVIEFQKKTNNQQRPENNRQQGNNTQEHLRVEQNNTSKNNNQVVQDDKQIKQ